MIDDRISFSFMAFYLLRREGGLFGACMKWPFLFNMHESCAEPLVPQAWTLLVSLSGL